MCMRVGGYWYFSAVTNTGPAGPVIGFGTWVGATAAAAFAAVPAAADG